MSEPDKAHLTGEFVIAAKFGRHDDVLHHLASSLLIVVKQIGRLAGRQEFQHQITFF